VRLPLRLRLFGLLYGRMARSIAQVEPSEIPGLRERQNRTYGLRAARIVMGRHAEGVAVEERSVPDADGAPMTVRLGLVEPG
jgi:hypothetical protein